MDTIKALLDKYARPFLAKYAVRVVSYGATAISAKLAIDAPSADWQTQTANWLVTAALAGITMLIDYLHHKADTATKGTIVVKQQP